ncbi:hypothetical protein L596_001925 [Steinernema carpocapsae]|uniref:Protein quiver n=1 Tax=Steinernema carpocapsae TaxID=34508 RepID=A0A4U8UNP1_STECR|nr:hypothetical protein L596_001925 [Steinernema carpocapsae]
MCAAYYLIWTVFACVPFSALASTPPPQRRCQVCSDVNIETHYGAFFRNPRAKLGASSLLQPPKCSWPRSSSSSAQLRRRLQSCSDHCFTLRVTSKSIGSNTSELFGEARGCATAVLSTLPHSKSDCFQRKVQLNTAPKFTVQAEYCFCKNDYCNRQPTKYISRSLFVAPPPKLRSFDCRSDFWIAAVVPVFFNFAYNADV